MARKKKNSRIDFRLQALRVSRSMDRDSYLRAILRGVDSGTLPRGLVVELHWRNPETKHGRSRRWQSGEFSKVVADSSAGFSTLLRNVIRRRIYSGVARLAPYLPRPTRKKKPVKKFRRKPINKFKRPVPKQHTVRKRKAVLRDSKGRFKKRRN